MKKILYGVVVFVTLGIFGIVYITQNNKEYSGYYINNKQVYIGEEKRLVTGSDANTFHTILNLYTGVALEKNLSHICKTYDKSKINKNFQIVYNLSNESLYNRIHRIINIGSRDTRLLSLSLRSNGYIAYGKDQNNIYLDGYAINVDKDTFTLLIDNFGFDKDFVYFYDIPLKKIDVDSFVLLGNKYIQDKHGIYEIKKELDKINPYRFLPNTMDVSTKAIGERCKQNSFLCCPNKNTQK